MENKWLLSIIVITIVASIALASCQPTPTPVIEQATVEKPTEAPSAKYTAKWDGAKSITASDCAYGGILKEISAVDPLTVKFSLCKPDVAFREKAAFSAFAIRPKEVFEKTGGTGDEFLSKPIGTGPYKLESWKRGDSITMTRNEEYWGEKGIAKTIVFRWSPEAAQRLLELQSGTVDGIDNPSPEDFKVIKNDGKLTIFDRPALNIFYIGMTNTFKPFDDVKVRQAIAMGIDRQRIVDTFYPEGSEVSSHFTPCGVPNGCKGDAWPEFNPEKAKQLLAEAGFPDGFETKLFYRDVVRSYLPQVPQVAQDVQDQLQKNLNIKATIEVMESGAFIDASQSGKLDGLYFLGWNADYPHITNFLDYHFNEANIQFGNAHKEIFGELEAAAQIADIEKAGEIYTKANNAIKELVPMIPVAHGASAVVYKADVKGAHASPLGNEYFGVVDPGGRDTFVWMQNAEPISLYCNDETDGESLRACEQVLESLLSFEVGGVTVQPGLATGCETNAELTEWVCKLHDGVKFHDGSTFDAEDVVMSWGVAWDATSPYHKGNTGAFEYMANLWGLIGLPE